MVHETFLEKAIWWLLVALGMTFTALLLLALVGCSTMSLETPEGCKVSYTGVGRSIEGLAAQACGAGLGVERSGVDENVLQIPVRIVPGVGP